MKILYSLLLVGVTPVWGWPFVAVRDAIAFYGGPGFPSVRFALAAEALAPCAARKLSRLTLVAVLPNLLGTVLLAGGELLTLLCAGALGWHIVLLSRCARAHDASGLAGGGLVPVQIFGAAPILSALVASEVAPVVWHK